MRNRLYTTASNEQGKTPFDILVKKKPILSHIRTFGAKALVHIPKEKGRSKFDKRAKVGYLVGFTRGNSYRVYLPEESKVVVSRDVTFDESLLSKGEHRSTDDYTKVIEILEDDDDAWFTADDMNDGNNRMPAEDSTDNQEVNEENTGEPNNEGVNIEDLTYNPNLRRSTRESIPPTQLGFDTAMLIMQTNLGNQDSTVPNTYTDAMSVPDQSDWKQDMDEEFLQINRRHTWKLVELPKGARVVKNRWGFARKLN